MAAVALRQEVLQYLYLLNDEQIRQTINYLKSFHLGKTKFSNSKSPEERELARQAFEDILVMSRSAKHDISLNGEIESANVLKEKYESIS